MIARYLVVVLLVLGCSCPGEGPDWTYQDGGAREAGPPSEAGSGDSAPGCGPSSCQGCCIGGSVCATGASHTQCGRGGATCVDCTQNSGTCKSGTCTNCTPSCSGKPCGASDGCGGTCTSGSGCCTPSCKGKPCGAADGCGGTCTSGSGCCTPSCSGKLCGASDGCGGTCTSGSGCCTPSCSGKLCGAADGCGGTCKAGSGCTVPACVAQGDADTLLLFTFEGSGTTVTDVAGSHDGKIVGSGATRVSGKSTCGNAMDFSSGSTISYVEVADSSAFDLAQGSVDFWVYFDTTASGSEGIVSRDASGQTYAGHFTILRLCNGSVYVRLQDTTTSWGECSDPLSVKTWHHIGVNFGGSGGLQLYIDGKLATRSTSITCGTDTTTCGSSTTKGIAGNDNPWVLGAASWTSTEGAATPVKLPLDGKIDSFRVSKKRRSSW